MRSWTMKPEASRRRRKGIIFAVILVITALLNGMAWGSAAFSDWYIAHVFPIWVNTYGRLTGLFPFSVGEWLIVAGLLLTLIAAMALVLYPLFRKRKAGKYFAGIIESYLWILMGVCLIMTLNCSILYHASGFSERYFDGKGKEFTAEDLMRLYQRVASECNRLCEVIPRDEAGMPVFAGEGGELQGAAKKELRLAMEEEARQVMGRLGEEYGLLKGWYPRPKAMFFSDFMCQQHMKGYYFPFSMEANYNEVMCTLNYPATMCHELAHLRGFIYEDEANLIGFLACMESGDEFFRYSGYLSVLTYIYNDLYRLSQRNPEGYRLALERVKPEPVSEQVWIDNTFVTSEEWERINREAWIDTEVVDKAADVFIDTNLKVNGVADGKVSYSRVVRLLLEYYDERLE